MSLAVNPRNIALLNRVPYLSVFEYVNSPQALDLSDLVTGGSIAAQEASLARRIAAASSWIDQYCFPVGSGGTLAASVDTDTGWTRIHPNGYMPLICRYKPVLELDACSFGRLPSQLETLTDVGDVWFGEKVIWVPAFGATTGVLRPAGPGRGSGRVYAQWSYVDGYPHTTLAGTVTSGGSSVPVASTLGVYPGTMLVINDNQLTETVTVASVGTGTVGLAGTLAYGHTPPAAPDTITVSSLPAAVNQAALLLVGVLIKTRGDNALVLDSTANMTPAGKAGSGADDDMSIVAELLDPFRIVT